MKVKELIRRLKNCNPNKEINFYFLKDYSLNSCEYETLIECNDNEEFVELTTKLINSDEGGCGQELQ
mgnify:FL=1|tara:strand:+ start:416 stop:616 length:201 start_codon:yes stop_codon:yes gene_type:complete